MRITDAFLGEHGVFYAQFDHLEDVVPTLERADEVRAVAAVLGVSLVSHAMMEDEMLFAPLARVAGADMGPIAAMHQEHVQIEEQLRRAMVASLDEARSALLDAIDAARLHFAKEERVAFPLAEDILGDAELRTLGRQWAERRRVAVQEMEHGAA